MDRISIQLSEMLLPIYLFISTLIIGGASNFYDNIKYDGNFEEFTLVLPSQEHKKDVNITRIFPFLKNTNETFKIADISLDTMVDYYDKGYPVNFSDVENYEAIIDEHFNQFNNSEVRPENGKKFLKSLLAPVSKLSLSIAKQFNTHVEKKDHIHSTDVANDLVAVLDSPIAGGICLFCNIVAGSLAITPGPFQISVLNFVANIAKLSCNIGTTGTLCYRLIDVNRDPLVNVIKNLPKREIPNRICSVLFQSSSSSCNNNKVLLKGLGTTMTPTPSDITSKYKGITISGKPITFAQLTDIHHDRAYKAGQPGTCRNILCCRDEMDIYGTTGMITVAKHNPAGEYGFVGNCDSPMALVDYSMSQAASLNPTFVYYTGDTPAHDLWLTSEYANINVSMTILNKFKEYFPSTPVYPVFGNHDANPNDLFAPIYVLPAYSPQWLYDLAAQEWPKIMFPPGTPQPSKTDLATLQQTLSTGAYYSVKPPGTKNFRVIGINNAGCYKYNWWLWMDPKGIFGDQLQWLVDTLKQAEDDADYVHLIYHVPTQLNDCFYGWNAEFHKIIARYSHLIQGHFLGHTHYEEVRLYLDSSENPINVAYVGGSVTTYGILRPNFRTYTMDKQGFITDYDSYSLPLDVGLTDWTLEEKFVSVFNVTDLKPASIQKAYQNMVDSEYLQQKYYKMKYKYTTHWLNKNCNKKCLKSTIDQIIFPYPKN